MIQISDIRGDLTNTWKYTVTRMGDKWRRWIYFHFNFCFGGSALILWLCIVFVKRSCNFRGDVHDISDWITALLCCSCVCRTCWNVVCCELEAIPQPERQRAPPGAVCVCCSCVYTRPVAAELTASGRQRAPFRARSWRPLRSASPGQPFLHTLPAYTGVQWFFC